MKSRYIIITRFVTVEAVTHVTKNGSLETKKNVCRYLELVPGQKVRVRDYGDGNLFETKGGCVELPADAWKWDCQAKAEKFVVAWQQSGCVEEVAAKLGRSCQKILAWERRYRREGVKLKRMSTPI